MRLRGIHSVLIFGAILLLLSIASCSRHRYQLQGYIEGQFRYLSSTQSGLLKKLYVDRGYWIKAGQILFALDPYPEKAQLDQAKFQLESAQQNYVNLVKGQRTTIIEGIVSQIRQAEADYRNATLVYQRDLKQYQIQAISKATLDQATDDYHRTQNRVKELQANLSEAKLGSRINLILAQKASADAAQASVNQYTWALQQKTVYAQFDARVVDRFFQESEYVPAGQTVLSILLPRDTRVIFYLPEPLLSVTKVGDKVLFSCDSCKAKTLAKINYISPSAEYTPPVIYSTETRTKLVYRVEAVMTPEIAVQFNAGQPVSVMVREGGF